MKEGPGFGPGFFVVTAVIARERSDRGNLAVVSRHPEVCFEVESLKDP